MKDLLEYIVTSLVSKPDAVSIEEVNQDGMVDLRLTVDPSDMGLIIGKGGQTIHAIRKLLTVRAIAEQVRVNLQLEEPSPSADSTSVATSAKEAASGDKEGQAPVEEAAPVEETPASTDADQGGPSEEQSQTEEIPSEKIND